MIRQIRKDRGEPKRPHIIKCSPEAREVFRQYHNETVLHKHSALRATLLRRFGTETTPV